MDPIRPTATASREAKRRAQQTLREIDALLVSDDRVCVSVATVLGGAGGPGPGSYDLPSSSKTMWTRPAALTMHERTRPTNKKTALIVRTNARETRTPGPGAYDVTSADRMVRPRTISATIREMPTPPRPPTSESRPYEDLDVARADKWLSRFRPLKGHVTYRRSVADEGLNREQRGRLRLLRLERSRHTCVGFYSVNYALTERRLGVHSMGGPRAQVGRHSQAQLRRKLMMLKGKDEDGPKPTMEIQERKRRPTGVGRTVQRQRATARALYRQQECRMRVESKRDGQSKALEAAKGHAYEMARQRGRDGVQCRQKNRRVVTPFASPPARERRVRLSGSHNMPKPRTNASMAFDKMLGRVDSVPVDAHGVYMVGREYERRETRAADPDDRVVRLRVPVVTIRPPSTCDSKPPAYQLVLSPHYDVGRPRSTRGHLFVRLENQLDRVERARSKAFTPRTNR